MAAEPVLIVALSGRALAQSAWAGGFDPIVLDAVSPTIPTDPKSKSLFQGKHYEFHFVIDETQAQLDALCPGPKGKGIQVLHFTGVQGTSTLTVAS